MAGDKGEMTDVGTQIPVFLQFANGLSVALVLTFVAILFRQRWQPGSPLLSALVDGVIFGLIGIAVMFFPFPVAPGAALDVRVVPVVLAGPFGGPGAAVVAGLIVAGYRAFLGGPGVVAEIGAILTVAVIGMIAARNWGEMTLRLGAWYLLLVGGGLVAATLGWTLILPEDLMPTALRTYTLPVAVTLPLGVLVLGTLLLYEARRRRIEISLRESEARLRAIIHASPAGIYLKDPDGRYTLVNDIFARRFALPPGEIVGNTAAKFLPGEMAGKIVHQDREVAEEGKVATYEFKTPYADGTIHDEVTVKFPVVDAGGSVIAIGGICTDITELKRAEEAARQGEALFREFFETAELVFITLDAAGRLTACNDFLLRLTGYSRGEVIGANWVDTFIPLEEREPLRQILGDTIDARDHVIQPHFENAILTRSGSLRIIAWDSVLTHESDGTVDTILSVGVDVTERNQALATIRREKDRAESYLAIAGTIILALDTDGTITLINRKGCEVLGYPQDELTGKNWLETVTPPDLRGEANLFFQRCLAGRDETLENNESEVMTKSGERRLIAWHNSPLENEQGNIVGSLSSGIDITNQRRAEAEAKTLRDNLAHVARLSTMGEMATGFAHELNQPLTAINNYAQGALRRLQGRGASVEELIPVLKRLSEQSERAGDVIRRIRWFIRKNAPTKTPMDINHAVLNALTFLNDEIAETGVRLDLRLDDRIPEISADSVQIQQVLINLGRNALDAMRTTETGPRRLEFATKMNADSLIEVTVSDTGPGIPPEIQSELFEPFVTSKPDGLGIGLSICRSLVQVHGGDLSAFPRAGGGTTFIFTLPVEGPN